MDDVFVAGWGTLTDKLCTTNGVGPSQVQNTLIDTCNLKTNTLVSRYSHIG